MNAGEIFDTAVLGVGAAIIVGSVIWGWLRK